MDFGFPDRAPHLPWRPERCDKVALVLQGGGALGAYQAGVYQALHEAGLEPDWVAGVSIGAINAAIIAGNPPEQRLERLRAFWEMITARQIWLCTPDGDDPRKAAQRLVGLADHDVRPARLLHAAIFPIPWFSLRGAKTATSYLRQRAAARDAAATGRFRSAEQRSDAASPSAPSTC